MIQGLTDIARLGADAAEQRGEDRGRGRLHMLDDDQLLLLGETKVPLSQSTNEKSKMKNVRGRGGTQKLAGELNFPRPSAARPRV